MHISEQGLTLIRENEGFSATRYLCPAGKPSIGYGHVIRDGETYPVSGISQSEAETLLKQDVAWAEQAVTAALTVDVTQNQFDALVSLTYNIGGEAFENSTLLRLLNAGDDGKAAGEFNKWVYTGGIKLAGLVSRRQQESALFRKDS